MRTAKSIILSLLFALPAMAWAQGETYTGQLKQRGANGAVVVVHQDAELEKLVNAAVREDKDTLNPAEDRPQKTTGPYTKDYGYRVQIFMAGNTAQDKAKVKSMARRFKARFPAINAYVYFNAPHWVCTTGDYKLREDANRMLSQIRSAGFSSACVVRTKINSFK